MRIAKLGIIVALGLWALGSTGCSLSIDKTFAMKQGQLDLFEEECLNPSCAIPAGHMPLEGGVVMRIVLDTTLLDYLDGTVDGDLQILDLLFGVSNVKFFGFIN